MTNTTTVQAPVLSDTQHYQAAWDGMPLPIQQALSAQGHTVVPDYVVPTATLPIGTDAEVLPKPDAPKTLFKTQAATEETNEEGEPDEDRTRIFLNTTIKLGGIEIRVKAAELTSDFHMHNYRDGKKGDVNKYMESLVQTIETHGLKKVLEHATIETSLTASGEGLDAPVDLLAGILSVEAEVKADAEQPQA